MTKSKGFKLLYSDFKEGIDIKEQVYSKFKYKIYNENSNGFTFFI